MDEVSLVVATTHRPLFRVADGDSGQLYSGAVGDEANGGEYGHQGDHPHSQGHSLGKGLEDKDQNSSRDDTCCTCDYP